MPVQKLPHRRARHQVGGVEAEGGGVQQDLALTAFDAGRVGVEVHAGVGVRKPALRHP
jgi:hypothetical protein